MKGLANSSGMKTLKLAFHAVLVLGGIGLAVATVILLTMAAAVFDWKHHYQNVTFVDVAADRARLVDWIESYVSVDDFVKQLDARSLGHEIDLPNQTPATEYRPPFEITVVRMQSFDHLGFAGEFLVEFFNNRLSGVRFYPLDIVGYRERLRSKLGINLAAGTEVRLSANARAWSATDFEGREYVCWQDDRLAEEIDLWIERYS